MKTFYYYLGVILSLALWTSCSDDDGGTSAVLELVTPQEELNLAPDKNAQLAVDFTCTGEWQARTNVNWAVPTPQKGQAGEGHLLLLASAANDTGDNRQGILTITSGSLTMEVPFTQLLRPVLSMKQDTYNVSAEEQTFAVEFSTNVEGEIAIVSATGAPIEWLRIAPETHAMHDGTLMLQVDANEYDELRSARITLQVSEGGSVQTSSTPITINQNARSVGISQDYSQDRLVEQLQAHSMGLGVPVVIMGDGFLDTDIQSGRYREVMEQAMENLFTEEPFHSLRDYFDVWMVTAVSRNNAFTSGYSTVFNCEVDALNGIPNSTGISGDHETVMLYAQQVPALRNNPDLFEETLCVVVLNSTVYAGTCWFGFGNASGEVVELAVCYCPTIYSIDDDMFRRVLCHEAGGHGFSKLLDEYSYEYMGTMPAEEIVQTRTQQQVLGWAMNVDFTSNPNDVLWSRFLQDERYQGTDAYGETLGVYLGACTYWSGAYRPTNESMMRSNTHGFNAPSRESIYKRVMKLAYGDEWTYDYEEFVSFDQAHLPQPVNVQTKATDGGTRPFAAPRFANQPVVYAR